MPALTCARAAASWKRGALNGVSLSLSLSLMFSEGQELPVDMETINLDRDAEVMPPAQLSLGV